MTATQFRERRRRMWKTQAKAAQGMEVSLSAIQKWEIGAQKVPPYIAKLITCMGEIEAWEATQ